jgi:tetratricopeptide (TPR) repeat protein
MKPVARTRALFFAVVALWICWASLFGPPPLRAAPLTAEAARQLEDQAFQHFYSLEYEQAIALFKKLRDEEPNNPNWQNHVATASFYSELHLAGALQGELFAASNKFFRTKKVQPDPALEKEFWQANQSAIRICEQRLKQDRKDEDALYACGVAYAARAGHQGLIERSKLETLTNARKANIYHSELARLNPRCYDAYLVSGLYDYVMGSLPTSLKLFLLFGGFSGDKERGIRSVESAAESGDHAKQDARILLVIMYRREKRYPDARRTLLQLAQEFPRNYIFPLELASVSRSEGEEKQAIREYEQVLEDIRRGKPGFAEAPAARIHFELGELDWKAGDLESAKAHLELVPKSRGSTPEFELQSAEMLRQVEEAIYQRKPTEIRSRP